MNEPELNQRLSEVRERIAAGLAHSGQGERAVTLVAVTKNHPPEVARAALAAGVPDLGENRVQELEEKVRALDGRGATWHLIGHLQRNKVRRALPLFQLLHSLDSLRLAEEIDRVAAEEGRRVRALVQVNTSGEAAKGGIPPERAVEVVGRMAQLPALSLEGMMTMAPFDAEEPILRRTFAATRELSVEVARQVSGYRPLHLSMGMSGDYEIAVEEGSTIVRLGTVLFGARER
jgi:PLP dependent protein